MTPVRADELQVGNTIIPAVNVPHRKYTIDRIDRRMYGGNTKETILLFAKDEHNYAIGFRREADEEVYIEA